MLDVWLNEAEKAWFNVLWSPIDRSSDFDQDAANAFIDKQLGFAYGFPVLLTGWIDSIDKNYPCRRDPNLWSED